MTWTLYWFLIIVLVTVALWAGMRYLRRHYCQCLFPRGIRWDATSGTGWRCGKCMKPYSTGHEE